MELSSPAFRRDGPIPRVYTCDGDRLRSPALEITNVPADTASLVLIMDDPDVPKALLPAGHFTHWVLFNIPRETAAIPDGGTAGILGANSRGDNHYTGPCPPPDYEPSTHRYIFTLYALDSMLKLPEGASKEDVEAAMAGHVIDSAELIGTYSRV